jgi:ABC-type oligopeptide transport system substrate-binding subunit
MLRFMKSMRIVVLIAVLGVVAACTGSGESNDAISVLSRGLSTEPESLDAHKARSTQAADVLRDIGEGLVSYSASGELTPGAAESWDVSDDGLTYTFHLRPNARWSNGEAVTAEHFVFGLRRLVTPATAAFYAQMLADVSNAEKVTSGVMQPSTLGVEAIDKQTLVIRLERPTPYLVSLLTHPATFPMHPRSIEEHGDAFARAGNLLSNGAYVLAEWIPGSVISLRRNKAYWNDAATAIDKVQHHVLTQEMTELARYRAGEIQITSSVPPESFAQVVEELGDQLHLSPYLGVYYYGYNLTKPPFQSNPELRQALSMAIDRELLVEKIVGRGETPAYSWVPPGVDNYEPTLFGYAQLSQDERNSIAQGLYKEAGYDAEKPLQLELRYNTSDTQQRVALAIQSMWREVLGVETELINEEFQVLLANMRDREITQVFRSSWMGDYNDAHTFLSIMQSDNSANTPAYNSGEFDSLMKRAADQVDMDRRRLYLEEAERVMLADHPAIPIYFYVSKHLVSPEVEGWGDNVLDYHYSQHLSLKAAE